MIGFEGHLDVAQSPSEAFELLADLAELHRWNPNVRSSARVGGERLEPGSSYESVIVRGPVRMTARSTLVDVVPGTLVRYEGTIAGFWSVDWLTFEPAETGTMITFRNESTPPSWLRPFGRLLNAAFQRQARLAADGARQYLAAV